MAILTVYRKTAQSGMGAAVVTSLFFFLLSLLSVAASAAESLENSVKAAYLTKFGIYVEWPDDVFSSPESSINICITGVDPFGAVLDKVANQQVVGTRSLVVRRLKDVTRDSGCHILYIGGNDTADIEQILDSIEGSAVLTVTDVEGKEEPAGIINFVLKDNRIRFSVDNAEAVRSGLAISSRLLVLAVNVIQ